MKLSDQALDKFAAIYKSGFKRDISRDDVSLMASRLVELVKLLSETENATPPNSVAAQASRPLADQHRVSQAPDRPA
jgi:hypothetical protein